MPFSTSISTPSTVQVGNVVANPAGTPGSAGQSVEVTGAWALSTVYVYRDLAYHGGATYVCKSAHTAAALTEPGVGANWANVWENFAASPINDSTASTGSTYSSDKLATLLAAKANTSHNHAAADTNTGTFANSLISASSVTQHNGDIDHDQLLNYVIAQHRTIDDGSSGATDLWSAQKIISHATQYSPIGHTHEVADINTGTFANALISQSSVTQHNAALDHGTMAGLADNDHGIYITNTIVSSLFTSPGSDFGVPPQNVISGENDGQGMLKLLRSATSTTLPTNTRVEMCVMYEGATLLGGWLDTNGAALGSQGHATVTSALSQWYWDGPVVIGPSGFLMIEDAGEIRFYENASSGDYYLGEKAPTDLSGSFTYTKPVPLANAAANDYAPLRFRATGADRGKELWLKEADTSFPTTDLYNGRRFYRTDLLEWFTYDDGTNQGSPAVARWIGEMQSITLASTATTSSTGISYFKTDDVAQNPGVTGIMFPYDVIVCSYAFAQPTGASGTLNFYSDTELKYQSATFSNEGEKSASGFLCVIDQGELLAIGFDLTANFFFTPSLTITVRHVIAA